MCCNVVFVFKEKKMQHFFIIGKKANIKALDKNKNLLQNGKHFKATENLWLFLSLTFLFSETFSNFLQFDWLKKVSFSETFLKTCLFHKKQSLRLNFKRLGTLLVYPYYHCNKLSIQKCFLNV